MAEYSYLSEPDPEFAPHMAGLMAIPQVYDIVERRARFERFIKASKTSYSPGLPEETKYLLKDHQIDVENGKILARTLVPTSKAGSNDTYPLMVWLHGGGWTSGNVELDDYQLRAICVELQLSIVNVDYRLAPEHPHPTGLNDSYMAVKWAAENAGLLRADVKKGFIIAGLSAGGHLAAVIAHRAREDPFFEERPITGQILQVPAFLNPNAVPEKYKSSLLSHGQNEHAPILPLSSVLWGFSQLGGNPADPEVSPLLYPSHRGLPPALIQVCGLDPLRDEALLYDRILRDDGVKTKTITYPGVPHAFQYFLSTLKLGRKWEEDYRAGLRWLLDGAPQ